MNDYFAQIGMWPADSKRMGLRYALGFVLSVLFTVCAYGFVTHQLLPQKMLLAAVVVLALLQVIVQLECFLHLGSELSARARLIAFAAALTAVAIVVAGSLWIMHNLNDRMMPSMDQMEQYMNDQDGF